MIKQFAAQKQAMCVQYLDEHLAFLQARYAKDYQNAAVPNEFEWPMESDVFKGGSSVSFVFCCYAPEV
eukprot:COSAG02_NODE_968_length_15583_cov_13.420369_6_plen_68_part_00